MDTRFSVGRAIAGELGQSALRPSVAELRRAAAKVGVSQAEARRALDAFNDPEGGASAAARELITMYKPPAPSVPFYRTELTPEGEQFIIPGCERDAPQAGRKQLDLF